MKAIFPWVSAAFLLSAMPLFGESKRPDPPVIEFDDAFGKAQMIHAPYPKYPERAREISAQGKGIFDVHARPDGTVSAVTIFRTTSHRDLDDAAVNTLKRWRFRPRVKWPPVRVEIIFELRGESSDWPEMTGIGPRGEALSNRQVRQSILTTSRIHYPKLSRRLRSRGTGLYEMRIDTSTGKVNEVAILKSSGARILDIECMRALGHWRFKPGTVRAARLPVTFELSWRATTPPESF
jgi:TonB family protein